MNIIDKTMELNAIKNKYGERFWADKNAIAEACEVWGYPPNNIKHGMTLCKEETLVDIGRCKGDISLTKTDKGYWLMGLSATSAFNGNGCLPNIWSNIGYNSYDSARKEGVNRLISFFEAVAVDPSSCNSETNKNNADKAVEILRSELSPQLALF